LSTAAQSNTDMSTLIADLSISLEGFLAGPDPSQEHPLGVGGEQLHEWAFQAMAWREKHDLAGGEAGVDSAWIEELTSNIGAGIMGRKMYSGGSGPWNGDPNPRGWWGENPPFGHPVFVLTHHAREPLEMEGGTTFHFVTGGIEEALERARETAGEQDIQVHGGGTPVQQALAVGALDVLQVHVAPVLLGSGTPLLGGTTARLERERVVESPTGATHIRYRVIR
jgi:dihydrofolate reductase